jgi:signal peptidase
MKYGWVLVLTAVFVLGWLTSMVVSEIQPTLSPNSYSQYTITGTNERPSPSDWVKSNQIKIYNDRIVIEVPGAIYAEFADTNSMDPVLDAGTNGIEIIPESPNQIRVGDIIAYKSEYGTIIHRVVDKGVDSKGIYFITKGDNNKNPDPEKVRFEQVERVLVALIY